MGYEQLKQILANNQKQAEEEARRGTINCPVCGYSKLKIKEDGSKGCPICGWQG